eukprot:10262382-Alexandrium_andersonii.AAC.1
MSEQKQADLRPWHTGRHELSGHSNATPLEGWAAHVEHHHGAARWIRVVIGARLSPYRRWRCSLR